MAACCSINMRIFKRTELALLLLFVVCACSAAPGRFAPQESAAPINSPAPTDQNESPESGDHFDQRQNGTENYRIHVDGLVVVVAPVEALLLAGGLPGAADSNIFGIQQGGITDKPSKPEEPAEPRPDEPAELKPKPEEISEPVKEKTSSAKSAHRPGLRLMSLLSPLLRKVQPQH